MANDSLIETTSPQLKRVSHAQGIYGSACQHQLAIIMSMSFAFVDGLKMAVVSASLANNMSIVSVYKMPIVGATRVFLLISGYTIAQRHRADFKSGDDIVGFNVIVVF